MSAASSLPASRVLARGMDRTARAAAGGWRSRFSEKVLNQAFRSRPQHRVECGARAIAPPSKRQTFVADQLVRASSVPPRLRGPRFTWSGW